MSKGEWIEPHERRLFGHAGMAEFSEAWRASQSPLDIAVAWLSTDGWCVSLHCTGLVLFLSCAETCVLADFFERASAPAERDDKIIGHLRYCARKSAARNAAGELPPGGLAHATPAGHA